MKSLVLRFVVVCFLVLTTLSFASPAFAEDDTLPDPGLTPDSPLYFFDSLSKRIIMFFTLDEEAKARRALRFAEERLAEARAMAAKNRVRETEQAADAYERYMAQVRQKMEDRVIAANLSEKVALATTRHLDLLERVREQVSPEACNALECARVASADGQTNALRALVQDRPERAFSIIEENLDRQTEKAIVRLVDRATGDNVTADADCVLEHATRLTALEEEMTALAGKNGANLARIVQEMEQSTSTRLRALSGLYENAPEEARDVIEDSVREYEESLEKLRSNSNSRNSSS